MKKKVLYVGLDVYKKTTDVAIAPGRSNGKVRSYGKISAESSNPGLKTEVEDILNFHNLLKFKLSWISKYDT